MGKNTDSKGHPFTNQPIDEVWKKGTKIDDSLKEIVRADKLGDHISKLKDSTFNVT